MSNSRGIATHDNISLQIKKRSARTIRIALECTAQDERHKCHVLYDPGQANMYLNLWLPKTWKGSGRESDWYWVGDFFLPKIVVKHTVIECTILAILEWKPSGIKFTLSRNYDSFQDFFHLPQTRYTFSFFQSACQLPCSGFLKLATPEIKNGIIQPLLSWAFLHRQALNSQFCLSFQVQAYRYISLYPANNNVFLNQWVV